MKFLKNIFFQNTNRKKLTVLVKKKKYIFVFKNLFLFYNCSITGNKDP